MWCDALPAGQRAQNSSDVSLNTRLKSYGSHCFSCKIRLPLPLVVCFSSLRWLGMTSGSGHGRVCFSVCTTNSQWRCWEDGELDRWTALLTPVLSALPNPRDTVATAGGVSVVCFYKWIERKTHTRSLSVDFALREGASLLLLSAGKQQKKCLKAAVWRDALPTRQPEKKFL